MFKVHVIPILRVSIPNIRCVTFEYCLVMCDTVLVLYSNYFDKMTENRLTLCNVFLNTTLEHVFSVKLFASYHVIILL